MGDNRTKKKLIVPAGNTGTTDRLPSLEAGFRPCSAAILAASQA
jgi:hypothetical protein